MRPHPILLLSLLAIAGCANFDRLRDGDLTVDARLIERAGRADDPTLEPPLLAILDRRIDGGYTAMDDERVLAAIHALEQRGAEAAVPRLEELAFDPVLDVEVNALVALETLGSASSLPAVGDAALTLSRDTAREQAYHTFSILAGRPVNVLDEAAIRSILTQYESGR